MSEISRARERMLNRRSASKEPEEIHLSTDKMHPRKFNLTSLTQQLEHRPSEPMITPPIQSTPQTSQISHEQTMPRLGETSQFNRTQRSYLSRAKENTPLMLKTINIKISEINHLGDSQTDPNLNQELELQSHFQESPPRVQYRRPLHKGKLELYLAPPQQRRHHSPFKPRECLKEWATSVIEESKQLGRSFVDDYFPPARTIVFNRKILYQQEGLKFERLSRIYQCENYLVDSCEPTLLSLGKYTNPYLFSALSILAEDPARVMTLFSDQQATEEGAYHVCLCKDGVWRYIIVDDFMPIKSIAGKKQMLFIHSRQTERGVELWPALIEKAIAKIYGTYLDLAMIREEGMSELFRLLTGAPASIFPIVKDIRTLLIIIDNALKHGHVVTLQAIHEEHAETAKLNNLSIHQAYRVLDIRKKAMKFRNYAEPELVTKLSFEECMIFSRVVIYRLEPNYRYITHKLRHKKHFFSKLAIIVPSATRCYIDVWQNNPAYYKKHLGSNINYQSSRVRMWLNREGEEQGEWIEGGKQLDLNQGKYDLRVHLCQEKEYDFTVSYYGEKDVTLQRIKCMEEWPEPCLCLKR